MFPLEVYTDFRVQCSGIDEELIDLLAGDVSVSFLSSIYDPLPNVVRIKS